MPRKKSHPLVGSDFEDCLKAEGRLDKSAALAVKRPLAWELERAMKESKVSQAELARRIRTSPAVVHRLLDANDASVTLATISKAATALGRSVRVELAALPWPEELQEQLREVEGFAMMRTPRHRSARIATRHDPTAVVDASVDVTLVTRGNLDRRPCLFQTEQLFWLP